MGLSNDLSPVRLGASPAAASTPSGVFNQRFEALFPCAGALCCRVCFAPPLFLLVYLRANVGPRGLLAVALPASFVPQSATTLDLAALSQVLWARAAHLRPSYQSRWMFLLYLLGCWTSVWFDFLSVLIIFLFLNCCPSFGCARRLSVSTYASILVLLWSELFFP